MYAWHTARFLRVVESLQRPLSLLPVIDGKRLAECDVNSAQNDHLSDHIVRYVVSNYFAVVQEMHHPHAHQCVNWTLQYTRNSMHLVQLSVTRTASIPSVESSLRPPVSEKTRNPNFKEKNCKSHFQARESGRE